MNHESGIKNQDPTNRGLVVKLIVGLGNPGDKYMRTRHNFGFVVLDELVKKASAEFVNESKFEAQIVKTQIGENEVILAKPQTFMNSSGESVRKLAQFYKIDLSDIWVIHDELDLNLGQIRVRRGGSSTHNGVKSVAEAIGESFYRIRLGIKSDTYTGQASESYILENFTEPELKNVQEVSETAGKMILEALRTGELPISTL